MPASTVDFLPGVLVRITATFLLNEVATDPTTVRFKYITPENGEATPAWVYPTDPEIAKDSVGVYHVDLPLTQSGTWYYRWEGEGTITVASQGSMFVAKSRFSGVG